MNEKKIAALWQKFTSRYALSDEQITAFEQYALLLLEWNKHMNLTAIETVEAIIASHFMDSLEITRFIDFRTVHMIADVGTGAGFPGLPLKIMFPHMKVLLIEVTHKKIQFLNTVVDTLGLSDVEITDLDWRTFLRSSALPIDLFLARASLQPSELLRIFKPNSPYAQARLVYWASQHWQPDSALATYVVKVEQYGVVGKKRQYVFFAEKQS